MFPIEGFRSLFFFNLGKMSDAEDRETENGEVDPAIWAIAPRLHQEEGPVDVSSSPAFQCLDEVGQQK